MNSPQPRFFFNEPATGQRLLTKSSRLKLDVWRTVAGDEGGDDPSIMCDVEIQGCLSLTGDDAVENFALLSALLREFRHVGSKGKEVRLMQSSEIQLVPTLSVAAFGAWCAGELMKKDAAAVTHYHRVYALRLAARAMRRLLNREATVADLTPENIDAAKVQIDGQPNARNTICKLRELRRQAILAGIIAASPGRAEWKGRTSPKPSVAEGTLWFICVKRYFLTNLNITSHHTRRRYEYSIRTFGEFLGHDATPADLTEEKVTAFLVHVRDYRTVSGRPIAARTVNEYRHRLRALWEWLARKKLVNEFPTVAKMPEPRRSPKAWSAEELSRLFQACAAQRGSYLGIPRCDWWLSLHMVAWDTAERIGALMQVRWEHLDLARGILSIPAELRKGGFGDAIYTLHADTVSLLEKMKEPARELVWPFPMSIHTRYSHYREILKQAGLPCDRGSKFHRMRRSVASHLHAGGFNASEALGHSSTAVTKKSYLDPSISGQTSPSQLLFRPAEEAKPVARPVEPFNDMAEEWL